MSINENNVCLTTLQNIEDSLATKVISDISFYNKIFCDLTLAKNALLIANDPDSNDNLTKMRMSDLEAILNNTYPKYVIISPCTVNDLPEIVHCSGSDGGLKSINNIAI